MKNQPVSENYSRAQQRELEERLLSMYMWRARASGITVLLINDKRQYDCLRNSGDISEIFDSTNKVRYILTDKKHRVLDMLPIALDLIDTPDGMFYLQQYIARYNSQQNKDFKKAMSILR